MPKSYECVKTYASLYLRTVTKSFTRILQESFLSELLHMFHVKKKKIICHLILIQKTVGTSTIMDIFCKQKTVVHYIVGFKKKKLLLQQIKTNKS